MANQIYVNNDDWLHSSCTIVLQDFPIKNKFFGANQIPFIMKEFSREVMKRSRPRNKFLKNKIEEMRKVSVK